MKISQQVIIKRWKPILEEYEKMRMGSGFTNSHFYYLLVKSREGGKIFAFDISF